MKPLRTLAVVGRPDTPALRAPLARLIAAIVGAGAQVRVDDTLMTETGLIAEQPSLAIPAAQLFDGADAIIAIGGDGTMISVARRAAQANIPFVGVNQGRLGFLTDISSKLIEKTIPSMIAGEYREEQRCLLAASLKRDAQRTSARDLEEQMLAMNDVVLSRGSAGNMIEMQVVIDGKPAYTLRADGLIISTPTGSTAYALSANGPIVHPAVSAMLMVPVAPHALTNRAVVLPDACEIVVQMIRGHDAGLHCDGQSHFAMSEGDELRVALSPLKARLLHPADYDYYAMLRQKLAWGETADKFHGETN